MENRCALPVKPCGGADKIPVIVRGRIVEEGMHEELIALGREYRKLYDLRFHDADQQSGAIRKAAEQIA